VGPRVVRVHQVGVPRSKDGANAASGGEVPIGAHANGGGSDSGGPESADERAIRGRDHQRLVTLLTKAAREEVHLSLTTAPLTAGVQVEHAERERSRHTVRMDAATRYGNAPVVPRGRATDGRNLNRRGLTWVG
jgi:hypothetical protein